MSSAGTDSAGPDPVSRFVRASDGLKLHFAEYGVGHAGTPVVCLPGLTRTTLDYHFLARDLSARGRRILALDYRGRGLSDRDPNWNRYNLGVEHEDILAVLKKAGVDRAILVGVSRGGLHTMFLAAAHPDLVAAACLIDIGPRIEMAGLIHIKSYVGKTPTAASWDDVVASLKNALGPQFPALSPSDWVISAHMGYVEENGCIRARHDPAIAHTLESLTPETPDFELWGEFDALAGAPLMVVRGEKSTLLSAETLALVRTRRPDCRILVVEGQGHAPLLRGARVIDPIADFVARVA